MPADHRARRRQAARGKTQAEALTQALVEKMAGDHELCIRMLTENAGDKASMHAMNVGIVSLLMGRCFGFSDEEMQDLGVGAMLHDIGKLDLPARCAIARTTSRRARCASTKSTSSSAWSRHAGWAWRRAPRR